VEACQGQDMCRIVIEALENVIKNMTTNNDNVMASCMFVKDDYDNCFKIKN